MPSKTIFSHFLSTQSFKTGQVGRQGDSDKQTGERGGVYQVGGQRGGPCVLIDDSFVYFIYVDVLMITYVFVSSQIQ